MSLSSREIIKRLHNAGWEKASHDGTSHVKMRNPATGEHVTLPHPEKDVSIGVRMSIQRRTGVSMR